MNSISRGIKKIKNVVLKKNPLDGLIERKDLKKLLASARYTPIEQKLFGVNLRISDSIGFLHSLEEIFKEKCYEFKSETKSPLIIDCGSNIGLSIIYFKKLFPDSKIFGFEPDKEIFKILESNISALNFNHVKLFNKGVWKHTGKLKFFKEGSLAGSFITDFEKNNTTEEIEVIRLKDFLNQEIDFLKIDVEGSENELIADIETELKNVKRIFIEYHSVPNSKQRLQELLQVLVNANFRYYIKEANSLTTNPLINLPTSAFDLQLNIWGYKI